MSDKDYEVCPDCNYYRSETSICKCGKTAAARVVKDGVIRKHECRMHSIPDYSTTNGGFVCLICGRRLK